MQLQIRSDDLQRLLEIIEDRVSKEKDLNLEGEIREDAKKIPSNLLDDIIKAIKGFNIKQKTRKGKFIVITGIDKSGKETQCFNPMKIQDIISIYDYLKKISYNVLKISLPSYQTSIGSLIGSYLQRESKSFKVIGKLSSDYAWILWSLDRAQYQNGINEWLVKKDNIILSKRWIESNIVYQKAIGIDEKRILNFENNIIKQDYTIIIDLPVKFALQRTKERKDLYEEEIYLKKVRELFKDLKKYYPYGKIFSVNGDESPSAVNNSLIGVLENIGFSAF